jgi:two-component system NtrC family sensor kinase
LNTPTLPLSDLQRDLAALAAQLAQVGDGDFGLSIRTASQDEQVRKISLLINGVIEAARRAIDDARQKQAEIQSGEARYRQLFASITDGVVVYEATADGTDFVIKDINSASLRIEMLDREQAIGRRVSELFPGAKALGIVDVLHRVHKTGKAERLGAGQYSDPRISGWRENLVYRLPTRELVAIYRDVTGQKQAEDDLRKSRAVLQGILNSIPVRVFWKDRSLAYVGCNTAFARDAGHETPEEMLGRTDYEMTWREQAELYRADDRTVIESGEDRMLIEEVQTTPTGEQIHLLTSKVPLRDSNRDIVGVLGTYHDITAMRRAQQDYRTLFREMFDGFALHEIIRDAAGIPVDYRFIAVNPAFERMTGLSAEAIAGRTVKEILPGIEHYWIETYGKVVSTGEAVFFENYSQEMDKYFRVSAFRPTSNQFACIFADISAQRRAEEEQRRLQEQLNQGQKLQSVGQLAAGIAHEINTPAQFVGDNLQFLAESFTPTISLLAEYRRGLAALPATPEVEAMRAHIAEAEVTADIDYILENMPSALNDAKDGVARISCIVRAMKEFAHPDQPEKTHADINHALEATLTIARNEYKCVADIETEFGDLPPVLCHLGELNQAFLNLLVNAAHAVGDVVSSSGEKGTIRVRTVCLDNTVSIEIADTGTGIPEAVRARVFEPFFTTKPVGKGSGQGLAIAYAVVVGKHGGTLDFDTELGKGTTFRICLDVDGKAMCIAESMGVIPVREPLPPLVATRAWAPGRP